MSLTNKIKSLFQSNALALSEDIKSELRDQGHVHTGKLLNSIKGQSKIEGSEVALNVTMNNYFDYVDRGVLARNIPFGGRRTGKKRSKYIEALIKYFTEKGKSTNEAKAAAFATARKHKQEGMPTRSSYVYSSNSRRLKFIDESTMVSKSIDLIETGVQDAIEDEYNQIFDSFEKSVR